MGDETPKSGWKTSEFWFGIAALVISAVVGSGVIPETSTAMKIITVIGSILAALGYTVSRTVLKK